MSGIEVAGLVLAVIPLVISGLEHYQDGHDFVKHTIRSKHRDEALLEFYEELHFELYQLRFYMERLIRDLPSLSAEYKQDLIRDLQPASWISEELSEALSDKLGPGNEKLFTNCVRRILESVEALVADDTNLLGRSDVASQDTFCAKLTSMRSDMLAGCKQSTVYERLRFNVHERHRVKHLQKITKYNKRLLALLESISPAEPMADYAVHPKKPSLLVRTISQDLHEAVARYWVCKCQKSHAEKLHDAKLCLKRVMGEKESEDISFSMIFSSVTSWQECLIHVSPKGSSRTPAQQIESVCALVEEARGCGICLGMLLDNEKKLWRTRPQAGRTNAERVVSLETLLNSTPLPKKKKRILAATLANIVLQLSEGPWMDRRWNKAQISFLESSQGTIDYERPYLSTQFDEQSFIEDSMSIHPSPSLLAFGILLLEIELGHPLEITEVDLKDGKFKNANSELTAAMRAFHQNIDEIYYDYRRAVQACLEPKFIPSTEEIDRNDQRTREAIYEQIVEPLEAELYNGFKLKIAGF